MPSLLEVLFTYVEKLKISKEKLLSDVANFLNQPDHIIFAFSNHSGLSGAL